MTFTNLYSFYRSDEWKKLREVILLERIEKDGELICEHCGKPIVKRYDAICHHKCPITEMNVNDFTISLNPENIAVVHHACHNEIHHRFGTYTRHIYIVYGPPCSGKTKYINRSALKDDIVLDINKLYTAISSNDEHIKSNRLTSNVFQLRNVILDMIKTRNGRWINAWIVGGYPLKMDRERLASQLGAELIFVDATKEECIYRATETGRPNCKEYIEEWFDKFQP